MQDCVAASSEQHERPGTLRWAQVLAQRAGRKAFRADGVVLKAAATCLHCSQRE